MRKDFDHLLRNTFFLVWSPGHLEFDHDAVVDFCVYNNFGHLMVTETRWCRSAGWYESVMPGGHGDLKRLANKLHAKDILFTLHGRNTRIFHDDPLYLEPRPQGLVQAKDRNYCFIEPRSNLQLQVSARWIAIADLVGADGLYLDGCESGFASTLENPAKRLAAVLAGQRSVFEQLTRPMILQGSQTTDEFRDYWCLSGQRDPFDSIKRMGGYTYDRDGWNDVHIWRAEEALERGYPAQVGWIDFTHDATLPDGEVIEDQNPASMEKLCSFARLHNLPIVLAANLEEIETHPQRDEMLEIIRNV